MKTFFKTGLVLSAFAGLAVICFLSANGVASASSDSSRRSNALSRPLYINNCARCHGADGRGDTELGRINEAPDISGGKARRMGTAGLTRIITRGKGSMPGFSKKLTKKQISGIVAYVRGL